MMRAAVIERLDGPGSVVVTDVPDPEPQPGEVVVEVHTAGLAFPEVLLSHGRYQLRPELPFVPGSDVAGTVIEAGPGASIRPGQRVAAWCGIGGLAERVSIPSWAVLPLPGSVPFDDAAAMVLNYGTAYFALVNRGMLQPGEDVLVHGAAGGLGTAAVQVARGLGAGRIIAVVSTAQRGDYACAAGADRYVLTAEFPDLARGLNVDVVVDPVGGERFTDSLRSLAPGGRLLVLGFTGGEIPQVRVNRLLLANTSVVGVGWGAYIRQHPALLAEHWSALMAMHGQGTVAPRIGDRISFADVAAGLQRIEARAALGKSIVIVRAGDEEKIGNRSVHGID